MKPAGTKSNNGVQRSTRSGLKIPNKAPPQPPKKSNKASPQRRAQPPDMAPKRYYVDEVISTFNSSSTAAPNATQRLRIELNPGLSASFPVSYTEAKNYTEWRSAGLEFEDTSSVNDYSADSNGVVIVSSTRNPMMADPTLIAEFENAKPCVFDRPSKMTGKVLRLALDNKWRKVRTGLPVSSIEDYDAGLVFVGCGGQSTNNTAIGTLRVRGWIELREHFQRDDADIPRQYRASQFSSTAEAGGATTVAVTLALGTTNVNGLAVTNTAGVITLPTGTYMVSPSIRFNCSAVAMDDIDMNLLVNGVSVKAWTNDSPVANALSKNTLAGSWMLTSDGTTTIAITGKATYSSGALTLDGCLPILKI